MRAMLRRIKRRLRREFIANERDSAIYGAYDDYLDGLITRLEYERRAQAAFRMAIPCDDCHRTDGTHDPEVEH